MISELWRSTFGATARALTFLEDCERLTLRGLVRKSAEHRVEVTVDKSLPDRKPARQRWSRAG
jgi:hypothetical protein